MGMRGVFAVVLGLAACAGNGGVPGGRGLQQGDDSDLAIDLGVPDASVVVDLAMAPIDQAVFPTCAWVDGGAPIVLHCTAPTDCNGSPCCLTLILSGSHFFTSCSSPPDECPTSQGVDTYWGRVCAVDDDCTRGLVNTPTPKCCPTGCFGMCNDRCS